MDPTTFVGRYLVVDDDAAYAEHIAAFLRERRPNDIAGSIGEADRCLAGPHPHVGIVIDLVLPDGNGLVYLGELRKRGFRAPALLLTAVEHLDHIAHVRASTLDGRILRKDDEARLPEAFRWTLGDFQGAALDYEAEALGPRAALFELSDGTLTLAEREVAELRLAGYSNAEVGEELVLSVKTVKNHVSSVLAKCGGTGQGLEWLRERVARRTRARHDRS